MRAAFVLWAGTDVDAAGNMHWPVAGNLLEHGVLGQGEVPTTFRDPVYPALLAGFRWLSHGSLRGALLLQGLLDAFGTLLLAAAARAMTGSTRAALVAALLYALYPYYVRQAGALLDFSLFTLLLAAATTQLLRPPTVRRSVMAGALMGLTALTRSAAVPLLVAFVGLECTRRRWRSAVLLTATAAAVCVPWFFRNHAVDGSFLPSRGGVNFAKGNNRYTKDIVPRYTIDLLDVWIDEVARGDTAREIDASLRAAAWDWIRENPGEFWLQRAKNLAYLYSPRLVPYHPNGPRTTIRLEPDRAVVMDAGSRSPLAEWAHALSYGLLLMGAGWGAWRRRAHLASDFPLYLVFLVLPATYAFGWPATRLRASADFALMILAACAVIQGIQKRGLEAGA